MGKYGNPLALDARDRWFESSHPDQKTVAKLPLSRKSYNYRLTSLNFHVIINNIKKAIVIITFQLNNNNHKES